jgi:hypothetical protein
MCLSAAHCGCCMITMTAAALTYVRDALRRSLLAALSRWATFEG